MIDRVQGYVQSVVKGESEGDPAIGRYLLDTLNTTTEGLEKGKLESLFNGHIQVCHVLYSHGPSNRDVCVSTFTDVRHL